MMYGAHKVHYAGVHHRHLCGEVLVRTVNEYPRIRDAHSTGVREAIEQL